MADKTISIKINAHSDDLDSAIVKAEKLVTLFQEARLLIQSLHTN